MPEPTPTPSKPGVIDLSTLSRLLMLSDERVLQLVRSGWISRSGRNEYGLVPAVQGYLRFLKDDGRKSEQSAAASALAHARRREIEGKIAREEARLIDIREHQDVVDALLEMITDVLDALPAAVDGDDDLRERIDRSSQGIAVNLRDQSAKRLRELQERGRSGAGEGLP